MIKEKKQTVVETVENTLTDEQMFIIEQKIQRDRYEIDWWKTKGRFNVMQYVKYLEYKEVNKA